MTEAWLPIRGFTGLYEISNLGRVRSLARSVGRSDGKTQRIRQRIMRAAIKKSGHKTVLLYGADGPSRLHIHRLVLEAFVGPCPDGMECCHNDGDPANNQLPNLRWDTRSANMYDKTLHGTHHEGRKTHCKHGHEFSPENTMWRGRFRQCRECRREWHRNWYAANGKSPRGYGITRTQCPSGHEYTPENTYVNRRGAKVCRVCARAHTRRYRLRKEGLAP